MADTKAINMHKRRAMGEAGVDGMRRGGAVKGKAMADKDCGPMMKKGGKVAKKKGK